MARDIPGGTADYLSAPNPIWGLDIVGNFITISAWIKADAFAAFARIVSKWAGSSGQYLLALNGTPSGFIFRVAGASDLAGYAALPAVGAWAHVAGRKNGVTATSAQMFLNGAADVAGTSTSAIPDTANDFRVGTDQNLASPSFDGAVAEVCVWNVALTDAEILALARGANPFLVRPAGIGGYFPLWGANGAAAGEPDMSPVPQPLSRVGTVGVLLDHAPVGPPVHI